ncbi:MAG: fumarylacetoacetate hydrolase family protein [Rhodobacterales bacterium]|nr:fumarylacetoacetate hydrolase family protein [Rhodobacterales bacterium]
MRFRTYERDGTAGLAVLADGRWRDLGQVSLIDLIAAGRVRDGTLANGAPEIDLATVRLLPPIPRPGKILCVGLNYVDHAAESPYKDVPGYPTFFARFTSSLIADGAPIIRPGCSPELDYEGELVAVIGKPARHVSEAAALDHVAGYAIFNDASVRDYQFLAPQWTPGKNFDGTGAFGPDFVTADELPPGAKGLMLEVFLNGQKMQSANTDDMVFPVATLVAKASEWSTLEPGDIIVTGTPAGVGFARKPQVFLQAGDRIEVRIDRLGTLSNPVANEVAGGL